MVHRGIRGASIALVCGCAVATAMGVLHVKSGGPSSRLAGREPSQRVNYEIRYTPALAAAVRAFERATAGSSYYAELPEFMTPPAAAPNYGISAAVATSVGTMSTLPPRQTAAESPFNQVGSAFAAAVGGTSGGFAYAYSRPASGGTLAADLGQNTPETSSRSYTTSGEISPPASSLRSGAGALASAFPFGSGGGTLPESSIGDLNTTVPAQTNPASPVTPRTPPGTVAQQPHSDWTPGPSNTATVPAPGTAAVFGMVGLLAARRRKA